MLYVIKMKAMAYLALLPMALALIALGAAFSLLMKMGVIDV